LTRYRQLEHTADIKVEIYGRDLSELFENACFCVFDLMLDQASVRAERAVPVSLSSSDLPELFMDWLRELLFRFSNDSLAIARAEVGRISDRRAEATLYGEEFDLKRHGLKVELKTPTYHQFSLGKTTDGYEAVVVFDA